MTRLPDNTIEIITTTKRLCEVAAVLNAQTELALDLEMDSLHHYKEKVCLMQVSTRTDSWLIDPLALDTVEPLAASLGSPQIRIVMHGADYDVRSLHRDFGIEINNLFDTMIAARFLGMAEFGLAALLKARFDIQLDKKYQKADWSKRPLTPEMCHYAAADTATLLALYDQLYAEILQKGRESWLDEECSLVCQARVTEKEGPFFISCKGAGKLKAEGLTVLELLLALRDQHAKKLNRPPFKVLSAETLVEIADKRPRTLQELSTIKGMSPSQISCFSGDVLGIIAKVSELPLEQLLKFPRPQRIDQTEGSKERLKLLKTWRDEFSQSLALDPGVLAPNWLLESLADANPKATEELEPISGMRNWQKQLYGKAVINELSE